MIGRLLTRLIERVLGPECAHPHLAIAAVEQALIDEARS